MTDDDVPSDAMRSYEGHRLAPLELPVRAISDQGLVDLQPGGGAVLAACVADQLQPPHR